MCKVSGALCDARISHRCGDITGDGLPDCLGVTGLCPGIAGTARPAPFDSEVFGIKYYKNNAQTPREALEEKFEEAFVPMLEEVPAETDGIKVYAISDTAALLENKEDMPTRLVVQKGKPMAYVPGSPQPVAVSLQGSEVEINGNAAVSANGSPATTGSGIEMDGRHVNLEPSVDTV